MILDMRGRLPEGRLDCETLVYFTKYNLPEETGLNLTGTTG
jgi:hypothetical protein